MKHPTRASSETTDSPTVPANQLAARLAGLRAAAGLSLDRLAERSGLTKSYLSKLERGLCDPSISSASRLAAAFSMGVAELLGDTVSDNGLRIARAGKGRLISSAADTAIVEFLTGSPERSRTGLSAFALRPPLSSEDEKDPPLATHSGDELLYVLAGQVRLWMADRIEDLAAGDSAWYQAEIPHRLRSLGHEQAQVLIVTCNCLVQPPLSHRRPLV